MRKSLLIFLPLLALAPVFAYVDDSLSFAYEAATPFVKQGFNVREDAWGGDLGVKDKQAIQAQLFKGNNYMFCLGTDVKKAVLSLAIYDSDGQLVSESTSRPGFLVTTKVAPKKTGTYYAIVTVHKSPVERTGWALVYSYK